VGTMVEHGVVEGGAMNKGRQFYWRDNRFQMHSLGGSVLLDSDDCGPFRCPDTSIATWYAWRGEYTEPQFAITSMPEPPKPISWKDNWTFIMGKGTWHDMHELVLRMCELAEAQCRKT